MNKLLGIAVPVGMLLAGCESMNEPLSSSGFDPLRPPGSGQDYGESDSDTGYKPGEFVSAAMNNTPFYFKKPKEGQDADKLLKQDTQMKVVSLGSSYLKVELDGGEVGFVPSVMITAPLSEQIPVDGIYEVYPPLPDVGGVEPLPLVDPSGLPPEDAIPTIIDPEAPADNSVPKLDAVPDVKPEVKPETEEKKVEGDAASDEKKPD